MTIVEAKRQLNIGYIFAVAGFLLGIFASEDINKYFILSGLIIAYVLWGTYWGFRIVSQPINNFFTGVFVMDNSVSQVIIKHILFKLTLLGITLIIAYFVGLLGGGIYKQYTLMQVK